MARYDHVVEDARRRERAKLEHHETLRSLGNIENRVKRLQAIVDKLPKCWRLTEAGKLVQDVSVVPGMQVWFHDLANELRSHRATTYVSDTLRSISTNYGWVALKDCYDTHKAAEAGFKVTDPGEE